MGWRRAAPAEPTPRDAVEAAMAATPRANHLPRGQQQYADLDRALPIGYGQTNSQPTTVRALLARLVRESGLVIGVERIVELVADGSRAVTAADVPWASVRAARTSVLGAPDEAPFDRILVSAQGHAVPRQLVDQL